MRIAEIAPPWFSVPPAGYGGIELVVATITEGLVERGHDVTLFAGAGSTTSARLVSPGLSELPDPALLGNPWIEATHALATYIAIGEDFDIVHDHTGIVGPALGALCNGGPPVVHTLHGPWTELNRRFYRLLNGRVGLVAISATQAASNPEIDYAGIVHNGIDVDAYPYRVDKEPFLVYIGRANPDKGPALAIEIARRANMPLTMVVKKGEPFERAYWDEFVAPILHHDVEVLEQIPHEQKADILSRASALVFPIQWPEPFGLVMAEAMACGTPVVACPAGAAVELVDDGVTGALASGLDELVDAVHRVAQCSPAACRARVQERFSADAMVGGYERVFERALDRAR